MDIQAKAKEIIKAEEEYTDSEGITYAEMQEKGWDSLLDTADNNIYMEVLGMSFKTAIDQPWHDELLDAIAELKNA